MLAVDFQRRVELPSWQEPEVPKAWRRGVHPIRTYMGQCYAQAHNYLLRHRDADDIWYVVGLFPVTSFTRDRHAWIIRRHPETGDDIVFEPVLQLFLQLELYEKTLHAIELARLTPAQYHATLEARGYGFGVKDIVRDLTAR